MKAQPPFASYCQVQKCCQSWDVAQWEEHEQAQSLMACVVQSKETRKTRKRRQREKEEEKKEEKEKRREGKKRRRRKRGRGKRKKRRSHYPRRVKTIRMHAV